MSLSAVCCERAQLKEFFSCGAISRSFLRSMNMGVCRCLSDDGALFPPTPGCFLHALRLGGATTLTIAELRHVVQCPEPDEAEEEHVLRAVLRCDLFLVAIPAELTLKPVRLNHSGAWANASTRETVGKYASPWVSHFFPCASVWTVLLQIGSRKSFLRGGGDLRMHYT